MVTLEDIAAATGFDKSTVSVTLRKLPRASRFSDSTRAQIHAAADRLGYRPNFFARQLADKKPRLLMLCVNTLRDPFAMMVAEGFEARAAEHGLRVLITAVRDKQDPLDLHRDILGVQGVPALALVGGSATRLSDASLRQLADSGVRLVLVNRQLPHPGVCYVRADDFAGGRMIAEHIFDRGLHHTWILSGMEGPAFANRLRGILSIADERGIMPPRVLECSPGDWADNACRLIESELKNGVRPPQAVMALSDVLALGASRALSQAGLVVGQNVAVTGYDDGLYARAFWPPLTTVRLPMAEMGAAAASSLINLLSETEPPISETVLPVELIVRESSQLSSQSSAGEQSPG